MSVHLKKSIPPMGLERLLCAFYARNLPDFLRFALPNEWGGVKRAILESGAWMTTRKVKWAPRWSGIHMTLKTGDSEDIVAVKSVLYRAHDCLHQLWGLPLPGQNDDDFYEYKRSQMCGEVAVLYCSRASAPRRSPRGSTVSSTVTTARDGSATTRSARPSPTTTCQCSKRTAAPATTTGRFSKRTSARAAAFHSTRRSPATTESLTDLS